MASSGTLTGAVQSLGKGPFRPMTKITLAWISTAGGAVNQLAVDGNGNAIYVSGELLRVVFVPGTPTPTTGYGVQLTDQNGMDVLAGQGASISSGAPSHICPGVKVYDGTTASERPIAIDDQLTLVVSAAGASNQGSVVLYLR